MKNLLLMLGYMTVIVIFVLTGMGIYALGNYLNFVGKEFTFIYFTISAMTVLWMALD